MRSRSSVPVLMLLSLALGACGVVAGVFKGGFIIGLIIAIIVIFLLMKMFGGRRGPG